MSITKTFEIKKERERHVSLSIDLKTRETQRALLRESLIEALHSIEKQSFAITTGIEISLVEQLKTGLAHDEDPKVLMSIYEELISNIRKTKITS